MLKILRTNGGAVGWSILATIILLGCATDPEQAIIGVWKADDSAAAMAARAAKLKHDSPDAEGKVVMDAARAMGHIGLDLRADKTFDLLMGGNTIQGSWSFDAELNEVQLDAKTAIVAPENVDKNPEPFKPATFIAYLNDTGNLRLYLMPRESYQIIKESGQGGKVGFVLYKQ